MRVKFTVLLNNYNYAKFIGDAIRSVLAQTFTEFQFVIVDDGSVDGSREVIESFSDSRILTVWKSNGGQASAFRTGLQNAEGEYVAFLDADDLWDPEKLEICRTVLEENPGTVLLNHSYRPIDACGKPVGAAFKFRQPGNYDLVDDLVHGRVDLSLVPTSFIVGRRKECIEIAIRDEDWRIAADTPMIMGLGVRGKIFNLDVPVGSYRQHGKNLWHGSVNDASLYKHYSRMYSLAQEGLQKVGRTEKVDFFSSDFAIDFSISSTRWYWPRGLYYRMRRRMLRRRDDVVHGSQKVG